MYIYIHIGSPRKRSNVYHHIKSTKDCLVISWFSLSRPSVVNMCRRFEEGPTSKIHRMRRTKPNIYKNCVLMNYCNQWKTTRSNYPVHVPISSFWIHGEIQAHQFWDTGKPNPPKKWKPQGLKGFYSSLTFREWLSCVICALWAAQKFKHIRCYSFGYFKTVKRRWEETRISSNMAWPDKPSPFNSKSRSPSEIESCGLAWFHSFTCPLLKTSRTTSPSECLL